MNSELRPEVEDKDTSGIYSGWFVEDKTTEAKEATRKVLLNSTIQFRLLKKILKHKFNEQRDASLSFDKPNLDQKRLYLDGYLTALQDIYRLIP